MLLKKLLVEDRLSNTIFLVFDSSFIKKFIARFQKGVKNKTGYKYKGNI